MPSHFHERWEGPIRGLRLPIVAWNSLRDKGITTLDQLKAVADRLEQMVGIGSKLAWMIPGGARQSGSGRTAAIGQSIGAMLHCQSLPNPKRTSSGLLEGLLSGQGKSRT
jgi:hypothetical protein